MRASLLSKLNRHVETNPPPSSLHPHLSTGVITAVVLQLLSYFTYTGAPTPTSHTILPTNTYTTVSPQQDNNSMYMTTNMMSGPLRHQHPMTMDRTMLNKMTAILPSGNTDMTSSLCHQQHEKTRKDSGCESVDTSSSTSNTSSNYRQNGKNNRMTSSSHQMLGHQHRNDLNRSPMSATTTLLRQAPLHNHRSGLLPDVVSKNIDDNNVIITNNLAAPGAAAITSASLKQQNQINAAMNEWQRHNNSTRATSPQTVPLLLQHQQHQVPASYMLSASATAPMARRTPTPNSVQSSGGGGGSNASVMTTAC